ncbi:Serine acetyltransferase [bioreactor metagenome]|uniref:Serine acetyltransferase n=1 Tax=bioreactor metagenome TaxID=1076179 RepID=A0A645DLR7_9ZZZZ
MTFESDPACESKKEIILTYPGFYAIFVHRIAHELYKLGVPLVPRIMAEIAHSKTGIDIHPGATIGEYFFIDHGTGIVIGETAVVGHHVKIYQGVTLGAISLSAGRKMRGEKRHPTIGDYVTIYSGASILGGDTIIGNNVTIGSSVFLTRSVEPNMRVVNKEPELILKGKEIN